MRRSWPRPGHGVRMQYDFTHDIAGPAGAVVRGIPALAAADPLRRHAHRLRVGRRPALDHGRQRAPRRAASHRAGRAFRRLARLDLQATQSFGGSNQRDRRPHPGHRRLRPRQPAGQLAGHAWTRRPGRRGRASPVRPAVQCAASDDCAEERRSSRTGFAGLRRHVHRGRLRRHRAVRADRRSAPGHVLRHARSALIAVIALGAVFITAEYRRGMIRTTLAASPRRGRVLAAKAIVIGSVDLRRRAGRRRRRLPVRGAQAARPGLGAAGVPARLAAHRAGRAAGGGRDRRADRGDRAPRPGRRRDPAAQRRGDHRRHRAGHLPAGPVGHPADWPRRTGCCGTPRPPRSACRRPPCGTRR